MPQWKLLTLLHIWKCKHHISHKK
uniref:Uncharacterized protein n=1 Tax=Rhizophora mucronata TaxID=61149 RepID=A0A2P2NBT7_RHIMU